VGNQLKTEELDIKEEAPIPEDLKEGVDELDMKDEAPIPEDLKEDVDEFDIKEESPIPEDLIEGVDEKKDSEMAAIKDENEDDNWYDKNTFECKLCSYSCKSLSMFGRHVDKVHETQLSEFSGSYTRTSVYYECQFCLEEVYHELSAIEEHVRTHFLTIKVSCGPCCGASHFCARKKYGYVSGSNYFLYTDTGIS
jgi:hypothetical protein